MNADQQTGRAIFGGVLASSFGTFILIVRAIALPSLLKWMLVSIGVGVTLIVAIAARRWWRTF